MRRPEELGRIGNADEPRRSHLEDAELVRRAEAVLRRTQDAVLVVAVTFELQDAVDEVLEDTGAGDRAVLRHVSDEHRRDARLLRDSEKPARRLPDLRHRAGRRAERGRMERLHRVDHTDVRTLGLERRAHGVELGLGEDLHQLGASQPGRAQRHLRGRFLAGYEQRAATAARNRAERREQERGLPHARLTADEDERCRDEPATQDTVELGDARGDALCFVGRDVADRNGLRGPRGGQVRSRAVKLFDERPEGAATRALAEPTARCRAALCTRELNGDLRHGSASVGRRSDAVGHESVRVRLQVGRGWIRVPGYRRRIERTYRMERLKALGRGTQIMFIASVLLLIISFFNWQEVDFDLGPLGEGSAGVSAWDNFLGILMGILTIVLIARIIARMAAVDVPIPVSFAMTSVVLGVIIAICAILKNLTDDYSTFWSYIGVGLAIVVAVGAWLEVQDAGGMESLKSEASSIGASVGAGSTAAAGTTTPAAGGAADTASDTASSAADTASDAASGAADTAGDAASSAADTTADAASGAADTASDAADAATDALGDEPSTER